MKLCFVLPKGVYVHISAAQQDRTPVLFSQRSGALQRFLTAAIVQGNCEASLPTLEELGEATGPQLSPQKPGQCLLSGFGCEGLLVIAPEELPIWIDNLYLRQGARLGIICVYLPSAVLLFVNGRGSKEGGGCEMGKASDSAEAPAFLIVQNSVIRYRFLGASQRQSLDSIWTMERKPHCRRRSILLGHQRYRAGQHRAGGHMHWRDRGRPKLFSRCASRAVYSDPAMTHAQHFQAPDAKGNPCGGTFSTQPTPLARGSFVSQTKGPVAAASKECATSHFACVFCSFVGQAAMRCKRAGGPQHAMRCCRGAVEQLGHALDSMHASNVKMGDRFSILGRKHRSCGSHGVVQLAEVAGTSVRPCLAVSVFRKPTVSNLCALERRPSFHPMAPVGV